MTFKKVHIYGTVYFAYLSKDTFKTFWIWKLRWNFVPLSQEPNSTQAMPALLSAPSSYLTSSES